MATMTSTLKDRYQVLTLPCASYAGDLRNTMVLRVGNEWFCLIR